MDERDYRLPELRFEFPGLNALVQISQPGSSEREAILDEFETLLGAAFTLNKSPGLANKSPSSRQGPNPSAVQGGHPFIPRRSQNAAPCRQTASPVACS
jgi:hypothetical protein